MNTRSRFKNQGDIIRSSLVRSQNMCAVEQNIFGSSHANRIVKPSERALTGAATDHANGAGTGRRHQERKRPTYRTENTETADRNCRVQFNVAVKRIFIRF